MFNPAAETSLEDEFAAVALQGLIASEPQDIWDEGAFAAKQYKIARAAYGYARAMMQVRQENQER